ncbi:hypothetical protein GCM10027605_28880 [Micromonospora zhanjiangensis]
MRSDLLRAESWGRCADTAGSASGASRDATALATRYNVIVGLEVERGRCGYLRSHLKAQPMINPPRRTPHSQFPDRLSHKP